MIYIKIKAIFKYGILNLDSLLENMTVVWILAFLGVKIKVTSNILKLIFLYKHWIIIITVEKY